MNPDESKLAETKFLLRSSQFRGSPWSFPSTKTKRILLLLPLAGYICKYSEIFNKIAYWTNSEHWTSIIPSLINEIVSSMIEPVSRSEQTILEGIHAVQMLAFVFRNSYSLYNEISKFLTPFTKLYVFWEYLGLRLMRIYTKVLVIWYVCCLGWRCHSESTGVTWRKFAVTRILELEIETNFR